jgi:hypothetical protein
MRTLAGVLLTMSLVGCFATVGPDGQVVGGGEATFTLALPTVLPPLVVVEPGVSVVSDYDQEVFYSDGYYWARQDRSWYRSHDHRRGWAAVDERYVPAPIVRSPPGKYRRYRGGEQRGEQGQQRRGGDHD